MPLPCHFIAFILTACLPHHHLSRRLGLELVLVARLGGLQRTVKDVAHSNVKMESAREGDYSKMSVEVTWDTFRCAAASRRCGTLLATHRD